jgi:hypothetical protein
MQIDAFRSALGAGGTRPNQYRVTLNFPSLVGGGTEADSILVSAAALPASNVNPTVVQYRGREVKFSGERVFDPWTISIMNDSAMKLRGKFEAWSNLMNNRLNNGGFLTPAIYQVDMTVEQLDRNDTTIRSYIIHNAFPITVSEISLGYGQNDVISEFTVTFQYSHFETIAPASV